MGVGLTGVVKFFHLDSLYTARLGQILSTGSTGDLRLHQRLGVGLTVQLSFSFFSLIDLELILPSSFCSSKCFLEFF